MLPGASEVIPDGQDNPHENEREPEAEQPDPGSPEQGETIRAQFAVGHIGHARKRDGQ